MGEGNFSEVFTPKTRDEFLQRGFFGSTDNDAASNQLHKQLQELLADENRMHELGTFSRRLVEERFSLGVGARTVDRLYRAAVERPVPRPPMVLDAVRTGVLRVASRAVPQSARQLWQ